MRSFTMTVLTCLPLIKTFCISFYLLFCIFTVYIVSVFLACFYNGCACDRFSAWSCSLKRAVCNTLDSQCLECYIYRLSTLDTMQKIGVWEWVVIYRLSTLWRSTVGSAILATAWLLVCIISKIFICRQKRRVIGIISTVAVPDIRHIP